jgi:hypothetical protein
MKAATRRSPKTPEDPTDPIAILVIFTPIALVSSSSEERRRIQGTCNNPMKCQKGRVQESLPVFDCLEKANFRANLCKCYIS